LLGLCPQPVFGCHAIHEDDEDSWTTYPIFRLDEKTKQIIKTWPLTTVRRWAAAPNVFTLDFGDYQDQYYSVQTTEGKWVGLCTDYY
jgi:hypothetical protein